MAEQHIFTPKNPQKYAGDPRRIVARSKWELFYMKRLDEDFRVAKWLSEPRNLNITYLDPITRQVRQYWPDFLIQFVNNTIEIVEIKPLKETLVENAKSNYDKLMLLKNVAKWKAAAMLAKKIGARFRVLTERDLFGAKPTQRPSTRKPMGTRPTQGTRGTRR